MFDFLEIGDRYFGGRSQSFKARGRDYVVGWDETVTWSRAKNKCSSIGGILAEIYDTVTLESIT